MCSCQFQLWIWKRWIFQWRRQKNDFFFFFFTWQRKSGHLRCIEAKKGIVHCEGDENPRNSGTRTRYISKTCYQDLFIESREHKSNRSRSENFSLECRAFMNILSNKMSRDYPPSQSRLILALNISKKKTLEFLKYNELRKTRAYNFLFKKLHRTNLDWFFA